MSNPDRLVFDRPDPDHPWDRNLEELETSTDVTHQAIAQNWRMDHRVSESWETELVADPRLSTARSGEDWLAGVQDYRRDRLCQPYSHPATAVACATWRPANGKNHLGWRGPVLWQHLVHVGSFFQLLRRMGGTRPAENHRGRRRYEEITGQPFPFSAQGGIVDSSDERRKVAEGLNALGTETVRRLAGALCDSLGPREPPWWATFAEDAKSLLDSQNGTKLRNGLGLGHIRESEWLIVWKYRIQQIAQIPEASWNAPLARPTVVEAGDHPWHFPSPPDDPYGLTMPLTETNARRFREVLHVPLRGSLAAEACTGRLLEVREPAPPYANLPSLRRRHQERMEKSASNDQWIERHGL
ncbi:MAG: hypothetical protein SX243_03740 [Acidobacteriota bacterium]|nr:hypothetical protein [Acidobacteriota bacterium]